VNLFRCESNLLRSFWVLVVMDFFTRRMIGFGIARDYIDRATVCRMFNEAVAVLANPAQNTSAPITTHSFASTAGAPTYAS